jgi:hypothetical protein
MAQRFKAKTLLSNSGVFNNQVIAPNLVYNTGNQTISGVKTFSEISSLKNPTLSGDVINKKYADENLVQYIDGTLSFNTNLDLSFPTGLSGIKKINYTLRQPSGFSWGVNYNNITWLTSAPPNPTTGSPVVFEYYPLGPNSTQSYGIYMNAIADLEKNRSTIVYTSGNQTISGVKTFATGVVVSGNLQVSGTGIFNALDLNNIDSLSFSGVDVTITSGLVVLTNPVSAPNLVYNSGNQTISGVKTFATGVIISGDLQVSGTGIFNKASGSFILFNSATAPSSPARGQLFFDTINNNFSGYNGTSWLKLNN